MHRERTPRARGYRQRVIVTPGVYPCVVELQHVHIQSTRRRSQCVTGFLECQHVGMHSMGQNLHAANTFGGHRNALLQLNSRIPFCLLEFRIGGSLHPGSPKAVSVREFVECVDPLSTTATAQREHQSKDPYT